MGWSLHGWAHNFHAAPHGHINISDVIHDAEYAEHRLEGAAKTGCEAAESVSESFRKNNHRKNKIFKNLYDNFCFFEKEALT